MNIKPIIFSTPMVEAILSGRKTQTRRVINRDIVNRFDVNPDSSVYGYQNPSTGDDYEAVEIAPYKVGDILWVRETWAEVDSRFGGDLEQGGYAYVYKASENGRAWERETEGWKWKPSIFMPKEAARIFLKVTDVRVERLQDILCEDMKKEGCVPENVKGGQWQQWQNDYFKPLWDSLNAKRGHPFESNPFVWVYEFERKSVE